MLPIKESERTENAKKNILSSFFLKGLNVGVFFLLVPCTLNYLTSLEYGIWLTLSSILFWLSYLDVGLGHGLRNKLAEALVKNDRKLANEYVSTCYALLIFIMFMLSILSLSLIPLLNWSKLLNAPPHFASSLSITMVIIFLFSGVQFVLKLINSIFLADQKPARADLLNVLGNLISLIVIYVLTLTTDGNLVYVSLVFLGSPILVLAIASINFFNQEYDYLKPSWKNVDFKHVSNLIGLGSNFFIIQIATLIMWNTSNFVIIHLLGPTNVTPFNIANRYLGASTMLFTIILTPFWSAYTEAYYRNDLSWIKNNTIKLIKLYMLLCCLTMVMIILAPFVYRIWVGEVLIPTSLNIFLGVYVLLYNWHNIFVFFINGVGKIKLQLISNIIQGVLCIPINIICITHWGLNGAAIALIIITFPSAILSPLQYYIIMYRNAKGIWNK